MDIKLRNAERAARTGHINAKRALNVERKRCGLAPKWIPEDDKLIQGAINQVWNNIACDYFAEGMPATIMKDEVIDACLDADRISDFAPKDVDKEVWKDIVNSFMLLPEEELMRIARGFSNYMRFGR